MGTKHIFWISFFAMSAGNSMIIQLLFTSILAERRLDGSCPETFQELKKEDPDVFAGGCKDIAAGIKMKDQCNDILIGAVINDCKSCTDEHNPYCIFFKEQEIECESYTCESLISGFQ